MLIYPNSDTSIAAMIVIWVIPIFNVLSTIALMMYGSGKKGLGYAQRRAA